MMRVQTEAIHFSADAKLVAAIERKLQRLNHYFDQVVDAKVILKLENSSQIREKVAEIKLVVPNGVIFIKESNKTFEAALDAAIAALKRQLIKFKEKKQPKRMKIEVDDVTSEDIL
jgi:putative sigma-54 modulation protein